MADVREKLAELLNSADICPEGVTSCLNCKYYRKNGFGNPCDEKMAIADKMIANGVTIQRWIPVMERLPDTFGEFVVAVNGRDGRHYTDYTDYDPYIKNWKTGLMLYPGDVVTHWMPLPEAPGEVER